MIEPDLIIDRKYEELSERSIQNGIDDFTQAERAIWFLVRMRCEKDMEGFNSIFEQALSLEELKEAVQHLNNLKLHDLANLFDQAVALLQADGFFGESGKPVKGISSHLLEPLKQIGEKVGDRLWDIDDALYALLQSEQTS